MSEKEEKEEAKNKKAKKDRSGFMADLADAHESIRKEVGVIWSSPSWWITLIGGYTVLRAIEIYAPKGYNYLFGKKTTETTTTNILRKVA